MEGLRVHGSVAECVPARQGSQRRPGAAVVGESEESLGCRMAHAMGLRGPIHREERHVTVRAAELHSRDERENAKEGQDDHSED